MTSQATHDLPGGSRRSLSAVVVTHDDGGNLDITIDRLLRALTITVEEFAIVIFDDGSAEETSRRAREWQETVPSVTVRRNDRRCGLGYCLLQAAADVETTFIAYVPGDNSWPFRSFVELFGNMGKADIVTSFQTNFLNAMTPVRRVASLCYTAMLNVMFGRHLHYYNGLTIYPVSYLRRVPIGTRGFGFQAEALIKAIVAGYSFLEVALPIDREAARKTRTLTPRNVVNSVTMAFRTFSEVKLGTRRSLFRMSSGLADPRGTESDGRTVAGAPLRIIVTGATSGIGAALVSALVGDGHQLFVCSRRTERLADLESRYPSLTVVPCDVSDEKQVKRFVGTVKEKTSDIDVLINCAGSFGEIGPLERTDSAAWWRTLEVNLFGTYLMIKHCLPLLERGTKPRIINFAGGGAFSPFPNYSAYACSKTAVVRLTECLADEVQAKGITVNAIAPGMVATELHHATLAAGEERAGPTQYRRAAAVVKDGGAPVETVIACVRAMISPAMDGLTGKTISSNFDPWQTMAFQANVAEIVRSDLFSLRRTNVVNLPDGYLRRNLSQAWSDYVVRG
jgi:NAD(P)-dependent dehydrogenase (short-subunit alcohol dehydrogenase family)